MGLVTTRNASLDVTALLVVGLACVIGLAFLITPDEVNAPTGATTGTPHVDHVKLPIHKEWHVVSVQPYEGLEEVELVKFDWPTRQDGRLAFALTREGLEVGDRICLDHISEIDTFWAHPMPQDGCAARSPGGAGQ